jgi:hypothetical protein
LFGRLQRQGGAHLEIIATIASPVTIRNKESFIDFGMDLQVISMREERKGLKSLGRIGKNGFIFF